MPTSFFASKSLPFSELIDELAANAMLAFIEGGRASLPVTAAHTVEQGFLFLARTYPSPIPKDADVVRRLEQELQVALLDGLVRAGTDGMRQALCRHYESLHEAADKRALPCPATQNTSPHTYDSTVLAVRTVVAEHLKIDAAAVSLSSTLVDDLGADSLDIVDFTMLLDTALEINIDGEEISGLRTVQDLVDLTCKHLGIAPRVA